MTENSSKFHIKLQTFTNRGYDDLNDDGSSVASIEDLKLENSKKLRKYLGEI